MYLAYMEEDNLQIQRNPYDVENRVPNFWRSCMMIDADAMYQTVRGEQDELWVTESGKRCQGEIMAALVL